MIIAVVKSPGRPATTHASLVSALVHAVSVANMYGIGWILLTSIATLTGLRSVIHAFDYGNLACAVTGLILFLGGHLNVGVAPGAEL